MMKTVVSVFNDFTAAANALPDFVHEGIPRDHISIVTPDTEGEFAKYLSMSAERPVTEHAGVGPIVGGLSGLLVGLGVLSLPGVGPNTIFRGLSAVVFPGITIAHRLLRNQGSNT